MNPHLSRRTFLSAAAGGVLASSGWAGDDKNIPLAPPDKQPPNLKLPDEPVRTLGWAIVGLGELALTEIMPAFAHCKLSRPVALVSGHPDKATRVAKAYGIDSKNIYNYETYDRLADNEQIDVIYIVLPNSMHAEYTIRGLKARKHVLCEKPMAVTTQECLQMIETAKTAAKKLMIAYRLHYEPFNLKVMEWCAQKKFGPLRTIATSNCQNVKPPNIRLSKQLGGGPVGDLGVYCINAARYITREEPVEVTAYAQELKDDPRFREVPASVSFSLRFPSGVMAQCDCSFASEVSRRFRIHCAEGWIDMENAFDYRGQRLMTRKGEQWDEVKLKPVNHFTEEMDHFSGCILKQVEPRTPGEAGLADMRVMEAIAEASQTGKSVAVRQG